MSRRVTFRTSTISAVAPAKWALASTGASRSVRRVTVRTSSKTSIASGVSGLSPSTTSTRSVLPSGLRYFSATAAPPNSRARKFCHGEADLPNGSAKVRTLETSSTASSALESCLLRASHVSASWGSSAWISAVVAAISPRGQWRAAISTPVAALPTPSGRFSTRNPLSASYNQGTVAPRTTGAASSSAARQRMSTGRRVTTFASVDQTRLRSMTSLARPARHRSVGAGQNTRRPNIANSAGTRVTDAAAATSRLSPTAGPVVTKIPNCPKLSIISPAASVPAEAAIAGSEASSALMAARAGGMESWRLSRYRLMSSTE